MTAVIHAILILAGLLAFFFAAWFALAVFTPLFSLPTWLAKRMGFR